MRCNNCGWQNEEGRKKCEKCNYPLDGSLNVGQDRPKNPFGSNDPSVNQDNTTVLGKTIKGGNASGPFLDEINRLQESQGDRPTGKFTAGAAGSSDPWDSDLTSPQERNPEAEAHTRASSPPEKPQNPGNMGRTEGAMPPPPPPPSQDFVAPSSQVQGTLDPFRQPSVQKRSFTLSFISREGEQDGPTQHYTGESIELNRDNVEPGNNSITSKVQAVVEYIDGAWYIVDKSALQTTFIQAKQPVKLQSGDVILLGDRKIVFTESEQ